MYHSMHVEVRGQPLVLFHAFLLIFETGSLVDVYSRLTSLPNVGESLVFASHLESGPLGLERITAASSFTWDLMLM